MDKEYLNLAKQEFFRDRDNWTNVSLQRLFWYQDLNARLADRQVQLITFISSVAIAMAGIVFPLMPSIQYIKIPLILLVLSAFMGIGLVLWTISHDHKTLPKNRDEELKVFRALQELATQNYSKALDGNLTEEDIKDYFEKAQESKKIMRESPSTIIFRKIIDMFYVTFFALFFGGFISFLGIVFFLCPIQ